MSRIIVCVLIMSASLVFAQQNANTRETGRDPTRPLDYQAVAGKTGATKGARLNLSSVLISAQRKLAIINGQSLREGQTIPGTQGVTLVSIYAQGVLVEQGGRRWELRLAPRVIKQD